MRHAFVSVLGIALLATAARGADPKGANACFDGLDDLSLAKYADAEKSFSQAIEADGENASYYQARGVARTLGENFTGALADFQRAARLAPSRDWETTAWTAIAGKMNNDLSQTFSPGSAPRADVDYAIALSDMAQRYWQSKNQGTYNDPVQKKNVPANGPYTGDFSKVAATYARRHMDALASTMGPQMTRFELRLNDLQGLESVNAALAGNSGDTRLLSLKGRVLLALNDLEGACNTYTDILSRDVTAAAYLGRAQAAAKMGDTARATRDLAEAIKLDAAAGAAAQKDLAQYLTSAAANNPQALWDKLETQAKSPNTTPAQLNETALPLVRAMAATRIRYDERYQDRLAKLEADLKAKPTDPDRMVALGRFLHEESRVLEERVGPRAEPRPYRAQSAADLKHDTDRADQLVATALRDHPNSLSALTLKAHQLIDVKDYDAAQAVVTKALALKKDDPDLLEVLASLLQIQAARHIYAAGNLRQMKSWYETDFFQSPPVTWLFRRMPTAAELAEAAREEQQAAELSKLAEKGLAAAADGAGPTPLGYYYRATLLHVRGDTAGAKDALTKAVAAKPDFEEAWYLLATINTELRDADAAIAARAKAYNLAQTTASAELNSVWYDIPHTKFKSARDAIAAGIKIDPADPRLPAYLAVIDEATEKPQDALAHYRMAQALSDANLTLHGTRFVPNLASERPVRRPLAADEAGFPAAIHLRIAALLFDQNKPADAATEFSAMHAGLAAFPATDPKRTPPDAILPDPNLAEGAVPLAETIGFLQIRAAAGVAYAQWAAGKTPADADFAAKLYRRLMVAYSMTTENLEAMQAIADLGLAELYVRSGQFTEAAEAMKSTPAVPQDFWQEMRRTETAVRNQQRTP